MGKYIKKYYNKDKTLYVCCNGSLVVGLYDENGECLSATLKRDYNRNKFVWGKNTYLVQQFARRGICLLYRLESNGMSIYEPEIFYLPELQDTVYVDLWDGFFDE